MKPLAAESLAPRSGAEALTVMVWLAETPGAASPPAEGRGGRMSLQRLVGPGETNAVSFEFFPPKTAEMEAQLWNAIARLAPLRPHFVSVTYGAGGSTRDRTHATVKRLVDETELKPAAHLTCVGAPRVGDRLRDRATIGRPASATSWRCAATCRTRARRYARAWRRLPVDRRADCRRSAQIAPFEVSVSAYPEKHPDSPSLEWDIAMLKAKIDAGATRAITQFAFDNDLFARFRDRARAAGIDVPIVPGLMPTTNFKGVARMAAALRRDHSRLAVGAL